MDTVYLCIDLKTFYASVECTVRGLDPFQTNLVVADPSRGKGAICLAISPKLKAMGVRNRCRIFEIPKGIDYMVALPRMKLYMQFSADVYRVYLKYIASEDIHVYSIDEAFLDVTHYLKLYQLNALQLAKNMIQDILETTGVTATAGIGTNLYLAKVALDITAKHSDDGIGYLDEKLYQKMLWHHQPLTDFWHVGRGICKRLALYGIVDMDGIAHMDERLLFREFGVNARYLIDHAWGKEPTSMADIKRYQSKSNSVSNHQVLFKDYTYDGAYLVVKEMVEMNVLELYDRRLVSDHISLYIGYSDDAIKATGGSMKLPIRTNSYRILMKYFMQIFERTTNQKHLIRKIGISFENVIDEIYECYDLFTDMEELQKEKQLQGTLLKIKQRFGKNAVLKGMNLLEDATTMKRNTLVGGHNAE